MTFNNALEILNISDYSERIIDSNSQGNMFHLIQYFDIAESFNDDPKWFREWFEQVVKHAEQEWERPESVFQHISVILMEQLEKNG